MIAREVEGSELCQDREEAGLGNWLDLGSKEREKGVNSLGSGDGRQEQCWVWFEAGRD